MKNVCVCVIKRASILSFQDATTTTSDLLSSMFFAHCTMHIPRVDLPLSTVKNVLFVRTVVSR